ncbi:MAG TPA: terminase family protein [Polyangia bacterium]
MSRKPAERLTPAQEADFRERYAVARDRSASLGTLSLAQRFAALPEADRAAILADLGVLDRARLFWFWRWWARPRQIIPDDGHRIALILAGRGFGKSRTMAERVRERVYRGSQVGAFVGPTLKDIHRYMIGGQFSKAGQGSGILDVFPRNQRPEYKEQKGEIHFHTGAVYYIVTAETPEWRGGNVDTVWCDEPMKWGSAEREALWDNMELSLRSDCGLPVEVLVSATPTPHPWIRKLIADPACYAVIGFTDENADNLEPGFIPRLEQRFGAGRKGRQERFAEILVDVEGAMFSQTTIDATRWAKLPALKRKVVAIDAAISTRRNVDATGIVGQGRGEDDDLYILTARAGKWSPTEWPEYVFKMAEDIGTREIVIERNRGGDVLKGILMLVAKERDRKTGKVTPWKYIEVVAQDGKRARADEVATLHEQERVHFPPQPLAELEDEITTWDPEGNGPSPNLLDAMTWGAHELCGGFQFTPDPATEARRVFGGFAAAQDRMPARTLAPERSDRDRGERMV